MGTSLTPLPIPTQEQISASEARAFGSVVAAGAGIFEIFVNPYGGDGPIEVLELELLPVAANVITILVNGRPISPAWDLGARQNKIDPGFILGQRGDTVSLQAGGAGTIQWQLRWRIKIATGRLC